MNVLILAAGYATRLYPLTLNKAKPLLDVAGKPMLAWVVDNLGGIAGIETIYIVTNAKFFADFETWAQNYQGQHSKFRFKVINDQVVLFYRQQVDFFKHIPETAFPVCFPDVYASFLSEDKTKTLEPVFYLVGQLNFSLHSAD